MAEKRIAIADLKELAKKYELDHVIVFATSGSMQFVCSYGGTINECDQAAQFADKLKDGLGWPESLHAMPSRVHALQCKIADYKYLLNKNGIIDPYGKKEGKK